MSRVLILVLIVFAAVWWVRSRSGGSRPRDEAARAPAATPPVMVECAQCAVHLPQSEAVPGRDGRLYCGEPHRVLAEGPPAP